MLWKSTGWTMKTPSEKLYQDSSHGYVANYQHPDSHAGHGATTRRSWNSMWSWRIKRSTRRLTPPGTLRRQSCQNLDFTTCTTISYISIYTKIYDDIYIYTIMLGCVGLSSWIIYRCHVQSKIKYIQKNTWNQELGESYIDNIHQYVLTLVEFCPSW